MQNVPLTSAAESVAEIIFVACTRCINTMFILTHGVFVTASVVGLALVHIFKSQMRLLISMSADLYFTKQNWLLFTILAISLIRILLISNCGELLIIVIQTV